MVFRSFFKGLFGFSALLGVYVGVVSLISGWDFFLAQFTGDWYWIMGLAAGFGVQIGLFSYLRAKHFETVSKGAVVVSGTVSGGAMLACCAHYLINILPIVGISGLAVFLGQYQDELFLVSLIFNLIGIGYLVNKLVRQKTI